MVLSYVGEGVREYVQVMCGIAVGETCNNQLCLCSL